MALDNGCRSLLQHASRGFTLIVTVICLATNTAAYAQVSRDEKDTLVAEFAASINNSEARRVTDLQMADDRLREVKVRLGAKLIEERARVQAIGRRLQEIKARSSTTQAELHAAEAELEKARQNRAEVSRAYTEAVAQNAEMNAAIETYKSQLALFLGQASREEQEAIRLFAEGDDSAYSKIKGIIRAENAARSASAARAGAIRLGQSTYLLQSRKWGDRGSRDAIVADWNEAIAADPTYGAYRVELCRYVWTAALLGRWGPREEPLQLEAKDDKWAVGTCQKMVKEASSPEDQLLLLSEMAFQYHGSNHNSEILRLFTDANRIIDSAIAQGKGTLGMLDPINRIANERSKVQRDLSRQRRPTGLGRLSHEERIAALDRHREEVRLAGIAVYQVAERQIDAILTQQGPAQHESRAWSGLAALARRVRRDDEAMAVKLLERARQSAGAALVVNPIDQAAHWWLANVLGALRLHVSRNESISLGLIEIDHWRSLVKLDSVRRDYLGGLASALASAASKMENSADRTRRIAFEQEGLALRIELARNVDPQKQLATTQELAETYSSLATSHGLARQWALAIENGVRGLELAKVAFELAEKDPLERAIRGGEPPDAPFEELRKLADFLLETGDRDRAIRIAEDWLSFLTARQPRVGNATPQSDDIDEVKELLDDLSIAVRVTPTS